MKGKYHGQGTWTYFNGDKYVGEWKDGKYHGQGTYTFKDGSKEKEIDFQQIFHRFSYWLVQENPKYNINQFVLQGSGEDCGVVSDCEELVGVTWRLSDL